MIVALVIVGWVLFTVFCIRMDRKQRREFFEEYGRYPTEEDYYTGCQDLT